jgi:hypothetical protein
MMITDEDLVFDLLQSPEGFSKDLISHLVVPSNQVSHVPPLG